MVDLLVDFFGVFAALWVASIAWRSFVSPVVETDDDIDARQF